MSVDVSVAPSASTALATLVKAFSSAIGSIPPLPANSALLTSQIGGNLFEGQIDLPVSMTPALEVWFSEVTAKLNAFASAK